MADVIEAVERAHAEHAAGRAVQPNRATVPVGEAGAILPMTAVVPALNACGLKLLSIFPGNAELGIPSLNAVVLLCDTETGCCEAVIEAGLLTAYRTAAASAVATKYLARRDACVLGLVGAGLEARTHLEAMRSVRPIDRVMVWSRTTTSAERFSAECDLPIDVVSEVAAVVREADILCTLTPARMPIVRGEWFPAGLHVNAVGTHWPTHREIDTEAVTRARVVVDSRDANALECGDLMIPLAEGAITADHFVAELGELVNGDRPGRESDQEITMYQSVGVGIQDVAVAKLVLERARQRGIGADVDLWALEAATTS